jgi:hypothetical protein
MREDICTIPVSEGFEPKDGCPICRMRAIAEKRAVDYIMGAAMMEPDVRIKTNEQGFCRDHFRMLLGAKNRLSLALMLDSHLNELEKCMFAADRPGLLQPSGKKLAYRAVRMQESCFLCDKLEYGMEHMLETVCLTYERDKGFRDLFDQQPMFCLPHCALLIDSIPPRMDKSRAKEMTAAVRRITLDYLKSLGEDVRHFCKMFDYHNNGEDADWGNSRDSIERAVDFLVSFR